jgi:hypothetical protein
MEFPHVSLLKNNKTTTKTLTLSLGGGEVKEEQGKGHLDNLSISRALICSPLPGAFPEELLRDKAEKVFGRVPAFQSNQLIFKVGVGIIGV